jgi:hypothetical protein
MMNDIELFSCYSVPLRNFLSSKGIRYKITAMHPETRKVFWVYIKNEQLIKYLNKWKETNPNK